MASNSSQKKSIGRIAIFLVVILIIIAIGADCLLFKSVQNREIQQLTAIVQPLITNCNRHPRDLESMLPILIKRGMPNPAISGIQLFDSALTCPWQDTEIIARSKIVRPLIPIHALKIYAGCVVLYGDQSIRYESEAKCSSLNMGEVLYRQPSATNQPDQSLNEPKCEAIELAGILRRGKKSPPWLELLPSGRIKSFDLSGRLLDGVPFDSHIRVRGFVRSRLHAGSTSENLSPFPPQWYITLEITELEVLKNSKTHPTQENAKE